MMLARLLNRLSSTPFQGALSLGQGDASAGACHMLSAAPCSSVVGAAHAITEKAPLPTFAAVATLAAGRNGERGSGGVRGRKSAAFRTALCGSGFRRRLCWYYFFALALATRALNK
jgi:hypothetical protein